MALLVSGATADLIRAVRRWTFRVPRLAFPVWRSPFGVARLTLGVHGAFSGIEAILDSILLGRSEPA
jgi:hypothetical protein